MKSFEEYLAEEAAVRDRARFLRLKKRRLTREERRRRMRRCVAALALICFFLAAFLTLLALLTVPVSAGPPVYAEAVTEAPGGHSGDFLPLVRCAGDHGL